MNIITKARESAFKDSAYGIIKAGELYYADRLLEPEGMTGDKIFTFPDNTTGLELNGSKPSNGSVIVTKEGKVAIAVTDGKYCITKDYNDVDVTVTEDVENCEFPELTLSELAVNLTDANAKACLTKGTKCPIITEDGNGTKFTIRINDEQTENFYAIADDSEKITLIMEENLIRLVAWNINSTNGPITALNALKEATSSWTNIPERIYTYGDDNEDNKYTSFNMSMRARIITYTEVNNLRSQNGGPMPSYLYKNLDKGSYTSYGYWTSSNNTPVYGLAYIVCNTGNLAYASNSADGSGTGNVAGARPVIELYK